MKIPYGDSNGIFFHRATNKAKTAEIIKQLNDIDTAIHAQCCNLVFAVAEAGLTRFDRTSFVENQSTRIVRKHDAFLVLSRERSS